MDRSAFIPETEMETAFGWFGGALRRCAAGTVLISLLLMSTRLLAQPLKAEDVIRAHGCGGCHIIPGIPEAAGRIGPSLEGISDRRRIAGDKLSNTPQNLRRWLKDPKQIKTTMMPSLHLSDAELDVLVKFISKL